MGLLPRTGHGVAAEDVASVDVAGGRGGCGGRGFRGRRGAEAVGVASAGVAVAARATTIMSPRTTPPEVGEGAGAVTAVEAMGGRHLGRLCACAGWP